ncbi:MAG TPA: M48 family metalloprotease [Terriglobales bacterium]|nr:M48 family metalloprotease [Terriglobales bacterium]
MEIRPWSRRKFMGMAGFVGGAAFLSPALLHAVEPHVKDEPYNTLTPEEEIALGRRFSEEYEKKVQILHNPAIDAYLNHIIRKLGDASQRPRWPYQVKVVNSAVVNASAIPGGFLYIQRGLLEYVEDENEMVGAMAHEVGHVVARHTTNQLVLTFMARNLYDKVKQNVLRNNQVISRIIEALGGPVVMLAQLRYSRENESEADMLGFYEMLRAGWNPVGLLRFFSRLEQSERNRTSIDVMLSDHPASADRAEAIRKEMTTVKITAPEVVQSAQFREMKGTLRLMPPAPKPEKR